MYEVWDVLVQVRTRTRQMDRLVSFGIARRPPTGCRLRLRLTSPRPRLTVLTHITTRSEHESSQSPENA